MKRRRRQCTSGCTQKRVTLSRWRRNMIQDVKTARVKKGKAPHSGQPDWSRAVPLLKWWAPEPERGLCSGLVERCVGVWRGWAPETEGALCTALASGGPVTAVHYCCCLRPLLPPTLSLWYSFHNDDQPPPPPPSPPFLFLRLQGQQLRPVTNSLRLLISMRYCLHRSHGFSNTLSASLNARCRRFMTLIRSR